MRVSQTVVLLVMSVSVGMLSAAGPQTPVPKSTQKGWAGQASASPAKAAPAKPRPGQVWHDDNSGLDFIWVPSGVFWMGQSEGEREKLIASYGQPLYDRSLKDELPRHKVKISRGFWISRSEVTVGAYRRFVKATEYKTEAEKSGGAHVFDGGLWGRKADASWRNPYFSQTDEQPVVCVSWNDAVNFARWLNLKAPGLYYRLPTEAEWEYVARAGQENRRYVWGDNEAPLVDGVKQANVADETVKKVFPSWEIMSNYNDGYVYTAPGGLFGSNGYGLKDLAGNVWEWCVDRYGNYPSGEVVDPTGATSGELRVVRGGSWESKKLTLRVAFRRALKQNYRDFSVGFRVVVQPE